MESPSFISRLPEDRCRATLDDVDALVPGLDEPILLPYIADTFLAQFA